MSFVENTESTTHILSQIPQSLAFHIFLELVIGTHLPSHEGATSLCLIWGKLVPTSQTRSQDASGLKQSYSFKRSMKES